MTGNSWCGGLVLFGLWHKFFAHCHVFPLNNLDRHLYLCISDLSSCCQCLLDLPVEMPQIALKGYPIYQEFLLSMSFNGGYAWCLDFAEPEETAHKLWSYDCPRP